MDDGGPLGFDQVQAFSGVIGFGDDLAGACDELHHRSLRKSEHMKQR